jgi:hypothetical protein
MGVVLVGGWLGAILVWYYKAGKVKVIQVLNLRKKVNDEL